MSSFDESTTVFESFPSDDISSRSNTKSQTNTVFARLTARAELNVPTLNTKSMIGPNDVSSNSNMYIRSPYFTIPPGLSPTTLLESPVFLSSPMAQQSPTTGKFQFAPGNDTNSNLNSESIDSTFFSFRPVIDSSPTAFFGASSKAVHESSIFSSRTEKEHPKVLHSQSEASPYLPTDINRGNNVKVVDISGGSVMSLHPLNVEVSDQMGGGDATHVDASEDGYNWRKYGQKQVKGSDYPRSYYRCTHPSCTVKKKVERSYEGHITEIIYKGAHNHSKPHPNKGLAFGLVDPRSGNNVQTWVTSDGSSGFSNDDDQDVSDSKIRKIEEYVSETSRATRSIKRPKVVVQTTSQVDILDDGYHWRKYGQKVVKGNPNPRGYYKCTSPGCIVRKHVERASHDLNSVITMYEGKHNHNVPAARNTGYSNLDSSDNKVVQIGNTAHLQRPEQSQVQNVFGNNMPTDMSSLGFDYGVNKAGLASLVMAQLDQEYDDPIQPQFGQVSEMGSVLPKGEPNLEYLSESCSMNIPTSSSVYSDVRRNYD